MGWQMTLAHGLANGFSLMLGEARLPWRLSPIIQLCSLLTLVPDFCIYGRAVRDQLRTVVGSKDSLDYMRFVTKPHGGRWIHEHRKLGDAWLKEVCSQFCKEAVGSPIGWAPARVDTGRSHGWI